MRILLVEDDAQLAELWRRVFARAAVQIYVWWVSSLRGARAALNSSSRWDAILLDLRLPDSDGIATLEDVRACARGTPILVITGTLDPVEMRRVLVLGEGAILKPASAVDVVRTLARVVGRSTDAPPIVEAPTVDLERIQPGDFEELRAACERARDFHQDRSGEQP